MEEEKKNEVEKMEENGTEENGKKQTPAAPERNIYAALAKAQGSFDRFYKNEDNTYFNSKYLTLAQIFIGIKTALSENGIAVIQLPSVEFPPDDTPAVAVAPPPQRGYQDRNERREKINTISTAATAPLVTIRTILALSEDQKIENVFTVKARGWDVQSVGSATTYARRYALQCLLGIAADEDDDGNAAAIPAKQEERGTPPTPRRTTQDAQERRTPSRTQANAKQSAQALRLMAPADPPPVAKDIEQTTAEFAGTPFEEPAPVRMKVDDRDDEFNMDPADPEKFLRCSDCGQAIKGHRKGVSTADATRERYGRELCRECGAKEEARLKAERNAAKKAAHALAVFGGQVKTDGEK